MLDPQLVYLTQTDTTAGFLTQDNFKLSNSKQRDKKKPFLLCVASLKTLKSFVRVPKKYKNIARRARKTTIIYPNQKAIRVVKESLHVEFLEKISWSYSSSANLSGENFDMEYAKKKADIIVEDSRGFFETAPSRLIKISKTKLRRLR